MEVYYPLWNGDKKIGRITQGFGVYNEAYKKYGFSYHNGIDIAEAKGTPVHGISGVIETVGNDPDGYGLYVTIRDEIQQCWWTYAHLSSISVSTGEHVYTGDVIGKLGSTGNSTGNHIHVECKPFNYKSIKNNGTLGRVSFSFFIQKEDMTREEVQQMINERMTRHIVDDFAPQVAWQSRFNRTRNKLLGLKLRYRIVKDQNGNEVKEYYEVDKSGVKIQTFSNEVELSYAGWLFKDASK